MATRSDQPTFFSTEEKRADLIKEANSWLRTPFVPHGWQKGSGVDCLRLVAEIYKSQGVIEDYAKPNYSLSSGVVLDSSELELGIENTNRFRRIWSRREAEAKQCVDLRDIALIGDLVCLSMGRVTHHVALVIGTSFLIHCIRGAGVVWASLEDGTITKRINVVYRPLPL